MLDLNDALFWLHYRLVDRSCWVKWMSLPVLSTCQHQWLFLKVFLCLAKSWILSYLFKVLCLYLSAQWLLLGMQILSDFLEGLSASLMINGWFITKNTKCMFLFRWKFYLNRAPESYIYIAHDRKWMSLEPILEWMGYLQCISVTAPLEMNGELAVYSCDCTC